MINGIFGISSADRILYMNDYTRIILSLSEALSHTVKDCSYLELGIRTGETFNTVSPYFQVATGVDIEDSCYNYISHNKNLKWYNQSTFEFIKNLTDEKFDIVFIDADHKYESSLADFIGISPFVKDNGLIILHDTYPPDVSYLRPEACNDSYRTASYIRQNFTAQFEIVTIPYDCGLSIIRKASKQLLWM